jgi:hypothetical protein
LDVANLPFLNESCLLTPGTPYDQCLSTSSKQAFIDFDSQRRYEEPVSKSREIEVEGKRAVSLEPNQWMD